MREESFSGYGGTYVRRSSGGWVIVGMDVICAEM
jgi:hypothetical protein